MPVPPLLAAPCTIPLLPAEPFVPLDPVMATEMDPPIPAEAFTDEAVVVEAPPLSPADAPACIAAESSRLPTPPAPASAPAADAL
jgi:hypothetical protein